MKSLTLLLLLCITGCSDMCGSEVLHSLKSPNGKLKAVSFLYDCGATTGFSTQVSILEIDETIESSGNVFVSKGKNDIRFRWSSDSELVIGNIGMLETYKTEKEFESVTITYK